MTYRSGNAAQIARTRTIISGMAMLAALGFASAPAHAAGTIAGTTIDNVATATYDLPTGGNTTVSSNTVTLTVDEVLDVSVAWADPGDVTTAPSATNQVLRFTLTNAGNGNEAFSLATVDTSGGDDFNPSVTSVVLDSNGNSAYDAGIDTVYVAGANDPVLAPDASTTVFILSTIPGTATDGQRGRADLRAVAVTGSGAPGTTIPGAGQGGGDAVVGATGADAEDDGYYVVSAATLAFVKSATVSDPFGGTTEIPGSIITYTLVATVSGSGSLANVRVNDPIPTGTTYRPSTIMLDAGGLSDANDADAGRFTGTDVSVALGNVAAGNAHTIAFQVTID